MIDLKQYIEESLMDDFDVIAKNQDLDIDDEVKVIKNSLTKVGNYKKYDSNQKRNLGPHKVQLQGWRSRLYLENSNILKLAGWGDDADTIVINIIAAKPTVASSEEKDVFIRISILTAPTVMVRDFIIPKDEYPNLSKIVKYISSELFKDGISTINTFSKEEYCDYIKSYNNRRFSVIYN